MTERELIEKLNTVYDSGQSESGSKFVRNHEQRSLQLKDIILEELKFMSRQSLLPGMVLFAVLLAVSMHDSTTTIWCLSSFLPLIALLMTAVIGKSDRFGMSELEAVCRFSLHFVRTIRMLIIGAVSLVLILICTLIAHKYSVNSFAVVLCFVSFPYLLNVFGNLLITRKWHSKEDIFFCAGATCFSCLVPSIARALSFNYMNDASAIILIIVIAAAVAEESIKYIEEKDRIICNW